MLQLTLVKIRSIKDPYVRRCLMLRRVGEWEKEKEVKMLSDSAQRLLNKQKRKRN